MSDPDDTAAHRIEVHLTTQRKLIAGFSQSQVTGVSVDAALRHVTQVACELLGVQRSSVWRFDSTRTQLECVNLFVAKDRVHSAGGTLDAAKFPGYFRALERERSIAANEVQTDARTSELTESYLKPLGITSMLEAPIFFRGELLGVICNEHQGPARCWQLSEQLLAGTFSDFVSMVLEAADRVVREAELQRYRDELEQRVEQRTLELEARNEDLRREVAERLRAEAQLRDMATRDSLTDAINRRHFFELAEKEIHRANRYGRTLSLAMVDTDHFKDVNDRYGHLAGDQVLRTLVEICRCTLRRTDVLARYGGEEFVVLLPETEYPAAMAVLERLREAVAAQVVETRDALVQVTVSAGVVTLSPGEGAAAPHDTLEELLRSADAALYEAKSSGRNRVIGVSPQQSRATG
ncbi:MAG: sensor domain-containing diguanylate cyclase [Myxococcaceae bacterium]